MSKAPKGLQALVRHFQGKKPGWLHAFLKQWEAAQFTHLIPVNSLEVLEIGCGHGFYTAYLAACGKTVFCCDGSTRPNLPNFIQAFAPDLPYSRQFREIYILGCMEFMSDSDLEKTASRFLAPGGLLFCLQPQPGPVGKLYQLYHQAHGIRVNLRSEMQTQQWSEKCGLAFLEQVNVGMNRFLTFKKG